MIHKKTGNRPKVVQSHHSHARHGALPSVTIHVGGIHASTTPVIIKTVLGSCVSVCLFDPKTNIGGMNHILLPGELNGSEISSRYGVNAMEMLINDMMKLGADRKSFRAKIFGGGDIFFANHPIMMIGQKNITFVRKFLKTESIPIISERVGRPEGLVVHFHAHTFEVHVKPISTTRFKVTEKQELSYMERITMELAAKKNGDITLF